MKKQFVPWSVVQEGDRIEVGYAAGDLDVVHTGTVGKIESRDKLRIYYTKEGQHLFSAYIDKLNPVVVIMLKRNEPERTGLF